MAETNGAMYIDEFHGTQTFLNEPDETETTTEPDIPEVIPAFAEHSIRLLTNGAIDRRTVLRHDLCQIKQRRLDAQTTLEAFIKQEAQLAHDLQILNEYLSQCELLGNLSITIEPLIASSSARPLKSRTTDRTSGDTKPQADRFSSFTMGELLALMQTNHDTNLTAAEIVKLVPPMKRAVAKTNIPANLSLLSKRNKIMRVSVGIYRYNTPPALTTPPTQDVAVAKAPVTAAVAVSKVDEPTPGPMLLPEPELIHVASGSRSLGSALKKSAVKQNVTALVEKHKRVHATTVGTALAKAGLGKRGTIN